MPSPGDPVRVQFTKWDSSPHWGVGVRWLGEDEHGWWLGWPGGTVWTRPGATFSAHGLQVGLFPRDRGFAVTFYEAVADYAWRLYADVATVPRWEEGVLTAVDLDLDVVQDFDGGVHVLDEDEFAEHRVAFGYPDAVAADAEREVARLADELRAGAPQFAESLAARWRDVLRDLLDRDG